MSDLITRRRAVTTTPSSEPPPHPVSAATAPALLEQDHVIASPGGSQAPASSASSVVQPISARRRHRPATTTETTSTDCTGASGAPPGIYTLLLSFFCFKNFFNWEFYGSICYLFINIVISLCSQEEHPRAVSAVEDGEGHPGDQQSYQHRIRRAPSGCTHGGVA